MTDAYPSSRLIRFRAACYNIHRAVGPDRRRLPERVAAVIHELNASIVGLQEVDWHAERGSDGASQAEFLAHLPGYKAIGGPNIRDQRGHYGNLLLTRFPVLEVARLDLTFGRREPRGAIDAILDCQAQILRVVITHFGLGLRERRRQSAQLAHIIAARTSIPTLLLGDLNEWMIGNPTIGSLLCDADNTDSPASFPSSFPIFALDRIVTWQLGGRLRVRAHRSATARRASDHLPVVADIAVCAEN